MKLRLGRWTTVVPVILSWTEPSPTTWRSFGFLHCPEFRRETKAGFAGTQTALPSGAWQLAGRLRAALPLKGAKVCQSSLLEPSEVGPVLLKRQCLALGLLGWAGTSERKQPQVQQDPAQRHTPHSS